MNVSPSRIVCLSTEAADWFWRLGAWEKVAGVTAFFNQPKNVQTKPRVSGFSSAKLEQIEKLNPDLVITFSDVQMNFATRLTQRGFKVHHTDPRTLAEIESTLAQLAQLVGRENEGEKWLREFRERLSPVEKIPHRPRVYFEEWNEPLVSGIAWISELIGRAGGEDIFPEFKSKRAAKDRIVFSEQIIAANPEIIFASWCGKPVKVSEIKSRAGWGNVSAVRSNRIFEIPGDDILQPGFRLVHGFERMKAIIQG